MTKLELGCSDPLGHGTLECGKRWDIKRKLTCPARKFLELDAMLQWDGSSSVVDPCQLRNITSGPKSNRNAGIYAIHHVIDSFLLLQI